MLGRAFAHDIDQIGLLEDRAFDQHGKRNRDILVPRERENQHLWRMRIARETF